MPNRRSSARPSDAMVRQPPEMDNDMVVIPEGPAPTQMGTAPDGTPVFQANTPGHAFRYLQEQHGLSPHAAAGIVDNLQVESGFAPDVLSGQRRGDAGTAAYAPQWRGDRLSNFEKLAAERGHEPGTLDHFNTQMDFAMMEMDPSSPYADPIASSNRNAILNAPNRHDAAIAFARHFERPAEQHIAKRPGAADIPGLDSGESMYGNNQYRTTPAAPPSQQGPRPQGLFGFDREKLQSNMAEYLKGLGEQQPYMPRSTAQAPQNTFMSAASAPWLTGYRG